MNITLESNPVDSTLIDLNVTYQNQSWKLSKTLQDIQDFYELIKQTKYEKKYAETVHKNNTMDFTNIPQIESFLKQVLLEHVDDLWKHSFIVKFFDNEPSKSVLNTAQVGVLFQEINSLQSRVTQLEDTNSLFKQNIMDLSNYIRRLNSFLNQKFSDSGGYLGEPEENQGHNSPFDYINTPRMSIISVITTDSAMSNNEHSMVVNTDIQYSEYLEEEIPNRSPTMSGDYTTNPSEPNSKQNDIELLAAMSSNSLHTVQFQTNSEIVLPPTPPASTYLRKEYLPIGEKSLKFEKDIDCILEQIAPIENQIIHRESIAAFIKRLIRLSLNSSGFEIGLQSAGCMLPDDPIRITAVISKSLIPVWYTQLYEFLHSYMEKINNYGGSLAVPQEDDELLDPYFNDPSLLRNHFITNITHVKQNLTHSIQLQVDGILVEICTNNRAEVCMLAFFEKIALLSQDHINTLYSANLESTSSEDMNNNSDIFRIKPSENLFKKSFLLLRAWWCNETTSLVGCVIKHYLSDLQLFIMLASIFNHYANFITSPFQAFCYFFAEYSSYDGNNQCISLYGITSYQSRTSNQPIVPTIQPFHMVTQDILEHYWELYNSSHTLDQQESPKKRSSSSEDDISPEDNSPIEGSIKRSNSMNQTTINTNEIVRENMKNLSTNHLFLFERTSFNILHPLNHTNMITEKISQRRVSRLYKVFQVGASGLSIILKRVFEDNINSTESIQSFFPNTVNNPNPWYVNTPGYVMNLSSTLKSSDEKLVQYENNVAYCDLMIESIVNDYSLKILAMEILAMKGPLPVGEIGKVLAETTSIPNLSLKLKEKFGGLKKFLELYPNCFVISNDHPFNPNVILRSSLTPDTLDLIDKGIFPHQLLIKAKKTATASKKKKSNSIPAIPTMDSNYNRQNNNNNADMLLGGNNANQFTYRNHNSSNSMTNMAIMSKMNNNNLKVGVNNTLGQRPRSLPVGKSHSLYSMSSYSSLASNPSNSSLSNLSQSASTNSNNNNNNNNDTYASYLNSNEGPNTIRAYTDFSDFNNNNNNNNSSLLSSGSGKLSNYSGSNSSNNIAAHVIFNNNNNTSNTSKPAAVRSNSFTQLNVQSQNNPNNSMNNNPVSSPTSYYEDLQFPGSTNSLLSQLRADSLEVPLHSNNTFANPSNSSISFNSFSSGNSNSSLRPTGISFPSDSSRPFSLVGSLFPPALSSPPKSKSSDYMENYSALPSNMF